MSIVNVSVDMNGFAANGASFAPVFSPDGTKIAFLSNADNLVLGDDAITDIFIKNLQTGQIDRIASNGLALSPNTELQFSPDGSVLLFSVDSQIYQATVQSGINPTPFQGNNVVLSANGLLAFDLNDEISVLNRGVVAQGHRPVFAPDGQRLAFNDLMGGLSVLNLNTGELTQIAPNVIGGGSYPASFSPDGSKIAFFTSANYVAQDTHNSADVYVYDFASQQMNLVSTMANGTQPTTTGAGAGIPNFSADGSKVFFINDEPLDSADTDGVFNIYMKDIFTGAVSRIDAPILPSNRPIAVSSTGAVAFVSHSSITPNDGNGSPDVFITTAIASNGLRTGKQVIDINTGLDDGAKSIVIQPDGKLVLAGYSYSFDPRIGGSSSFDFSMVRLNVDGSFDTSFGMGGKQVIDVNNGSGDSAGSVVIQEDGKLVLAGFSDSFDSNTGLPSSDFSVVRLNVDGSLDTSFGMGGKQIIDINNGTYDRAESIVIQADGKLVLVGFSNGDYGAIRLNTDGSIDTSFGMSGKQVIDINNGSRDEAGSVVIQEDGKLVLAGFSDSFNPNTGVTSTDFSAIRLNTDGSLDTSFGMGGKQIIDINNGSYDMAMGVSLQDGKLVLAGGSNGDYGVIRLNTDGNLDTNFGMGGKQVIDINGSGDFATGVSLQADGKLILAGFSGYTDSNTGSYLNDFSAIRLNTDGSLDASFGMGGKQVVDINNASNDRAESVVIQADGKLVLAGYSNVAGFSEGNHGVIRLNTDGSLDTSFGALGNNQSTPVANVDYATVVAGGFMTIDVLSNDYNPNEDVLNITSAVSRNGLGNVFINGDGTISYSSYLSSSSVDYIDYTIVDSYGHSSSSYVMMNINSRPEVSNVFVSGSEDDAFITGSLSGYDPEGSPLSYHLINAPAGVMLNGNGTFTVDVAAVPVAISRYSGSLTSGDEVIDTSPFAGASIVDSYALDMLQAGNRYYLRTTGNFDTILKVIDQHGNLVVANDDGGIAHLSLLTFEALEGNSYTAYVGAFQNRLDGNTAYDLVVEQVGAVNNLNDGQSQIITLEYVANDGLSDSRPEATITITINGVTDEGSVLGADGGETNIIRNQDGTTTHTHSNDGTGNDWQQTLNSSGQLITQTDTDQANTESWMTRIDTFDNNGSRISVTLFNDDGSRDELGFNVDGSQEQNRHYDAIGGLDYIVTINTDGSIDWQDEDQANNQSWTTVNSHQTPMGALDWRRYVNDDGTQEWLDVDQDNTQAWSEQTTRQNTLGQDVSRTVVWDNGSVDVMQLNTDGLELWQQNTQHFDASGIYTGSDVLLGTGIAANQVWLRQEGNNLEVSQIGGGNTMLIADWFSGNAKTNFSIDGVSGSLTANEVQTLVDAMASFAPPAVGQTTLPQNYQDALGSVIAASWS